ncbi:flagellar filament capping protein FliD, partial [Gammaproteobacteria bacterium]|nr:flagellar filament capping protein FliD [Gammaproteobacteria bacterium]
LDSTRYAAALKTNFIDIRTMLTGDLNNQTASDVRDHGLALDIITSLDGLVKNTGSIKAKETSTAAAVAKYEEQLLDLTERLEGIKSRYMKQFAAMETLVQRSKNTGDYLEGQFKAMESMYSN